MLPISDIKTITISSDLMVAVSDKIPGILAHGTTMAELKAELTAVMKYLAEQNTGQ